MAVSLPGRWSSSLEVLSGLGVGALGFRGLGIRALYLEFPRRCYIRQQMPQLLPKERICGSGVLQVSTSCALTLQSSPKEIGQRNVGLSHANYVLQIPYIALNPKP